MEIRRRPLGRGARLRRRLVAAVSLAAVGWAFYLGADFLLRSPKVLLTDLRQVEVRGGRLVNAADVAGVFAADLGRSVLRVPLGERRAAIERIPWVERATVRRILPNRIVVEITERRPVAFARLGSELALMDARGVLLERRLGDAYRFPVVTGVSPDMPRAERERRVRLFLDFLAQAEQVRPGATEYVSEVGLADPSDLQAVLAGLPELSQGEGGQPSVRVHFGDRDFGRRFRTLMENIGQWRASAGRVESVDLRFERQVVVNPETRP